MTNLIRHLHVSLDLKVAFDSVDQAFFALPLVEKCHRETPLIHSMNEDSQSRFRAYSGFPLEFTIISDALLGCSLSPFLFNFANEMVMNISWGQWN